MGGRARLPVTAAHPNSPRTVVARHPAPAATVAIVTGVERAAPEARATEAKATEAEAATEAMETAAVEATETTAEVACVGVGGCDSQCCRHDGGSSESKDGFGDHDTTPVEHQLTKP